MQTLTPQSPVFADWLAHTTPLTEFVFVRDSVTAVLADAGAVRDGERFLFVNGGSVMIREAHSVGYFGVSGQALTALRETGRFADYLAAVGQHPHRVTRLDAAMDFCMDAQPVCDSVYALYRSGYVLNGRKCPTTRQTSIDQYGRDSGTVYLGRRGKNRSVLIRVYDKRHQQIEAGNPDPGPWLRVEVESHIAGMTLRDVVLPEPLFHTLAPAGLVDRPSDVVPWLPQDGGFELPPREPQGADMRARSIIQNWDDMGRLARLVDQIPGEGVDVVVAMFRAELLRQKRHQDAKSAMGKPAAPSPVQ